MLILPLLSESELSKAEGAAKVIRWFGAEMLASDKMDASCARQRQHR